MLGWLKRRPELDVEFMIEEVPDDVMLTGDDLSIEHQAAITNTLIISQLEDQLEQAMGLLAWQGQVIEAARQFAILIATTNEKTGEPVFKTTQDGDTLAAEALVHRFVDLTALLNQGVRPVPAKFNQGTVH